MPVFFAFIVVGLLAYIAFALHTMVDNQTKMDRNMKKEAAAIFLLLRGIKATLIQVADKGINLSNVDSGDLFDFGMSLEKFADALSENKGQWNPDSRPTLDA